MIISREPYILQTSFKLCFSSFNKIFQIMSIISSYSIILFYFFKFFFVLCLSSSLFSSQGFFPFPFFCSLPPLQYQYYYHIRIGYAPHLKINQQEIIPHITFYAQHACNNKHYTLLTLKYGVKVSTRTHNSQLHAYIP